MKKFVRSLLVPAFIVSVILAAGCSTARQQATAGSPATAKPCQQLVVFPMGPAPVTINQGGVTCTHGSLVGVTGGYSPEPMVSVAVQQDLVYGPDCNFTFQMGSSTYVINAQQGFCNLEAGKVTASVVSGDATITSTTEGSYSQGKPGLVGVTLNAPGAAAAPRGPQMTMCQFLKIVPTTTLGQPVMVPSAGVNCKHGSLFQIDPVSSDVYSVWLEQSAGYGPDCEISFEVGSSVYVIQAQQGACGLEAGSVSASVVAGNAKITSTTNGSFHDNTPGIVNVSLD